MTCILFFSSFLRVKNNWIEEGGWIEEGETINADTLADYFIKVISPELAYLRLESGNYLTLEKTGNENEIIIINKNRFSALGYRQAGVLQSNCLKYLPNNPEESLKKVWTFQLFTLNDKKGSLPKKMILKPYSFQQKQTAWMNLSEWVVKWSAHQVHL